jgi:hypothetical protein
MSAKQDLDEQNYRDMLVGWEAGLGGMPIPVCRDMLAGWEAGLGGTGMEQNLLGSSLAIPIVTATCVMVAYFRSQADGVGLHPLNLFWPSFPC